MNELEKFIEQCISKKDEYTELELIRYVYIKLGQMMSFNLDFFYGNNKMKDKIYSKNSEKDLIDSFETHTIICKSLSYIIERILKSLTIKTESVVDYNVYETYCHVYNVSFLSDGRRITLDLQLDLENIQSHQRTRYFAPDTISKEELEIIDMKIGYISKDNLYAEDYFNMLEKALEGNVSLKEKISLILQNINAYTNVTNMEYAERKKYYSRFIRRFLNDKEKSKISFIDSYEMRDNKKEYSLCVVLENTNKENIIFMYSNEKGLFEQYDIKELNGLVQDGLILLSNVPGIKCASSSNFKSK